MLTHELDPTRIYCTTGTSKQGTQQKHKKEHTLRVDLKNKI